MITVPLTVPFSSYMYMYSVNWEYAVVCLYIYMFVPLPLFKTPISSLYCSLKCQSSQMTDLSGCPLCGGFTTKDSEKDIKNHFLSIFR